MQPQIATSAAEASNPTSRSGNETVSSRATGPGIEEGVQFEFAAPPRPQASQTIEHSAQTALPSSSTSAPTETDPVEPTSRHSTDLRSFITVDQAPVMSDRTEPVVESVAEALATPSPSSTYGMAFERANSHSRIRSSVDAERGRTESPAAVSLDSDTRSFGELVMVNRPAKTARSISSSIRISGKRKTQVIVAFVCLIIIGIAAMLALGRHQGMGPAATLPADEVTVLTTATKVTWLDREMDAFNKDNAGRFHATRLPLLESRDGMKAILEGKVKPVIFTPSSPVWIARLNEVYAQQNPTVSVADMDDPKAFRYLLRSPLVIVTTKGKAAFYSRLFQGPEPWHRIRELSMGTTHTPWGSFKFAHADPLDATSGMLTMSLIVNEYVSESGLNEPTEEIVKDPAFKQWLGELETKFVRDPAAVGSSALERAFVADPTSRDFITAYESKGLEAVEKNPNLTIIYPSITNEAQQSLIVLNAPWVTDQARKGAVAFLDYLQSPKAQHDALALHFRPVTDTSGTALASVLTPQEKAVYHDSYITSSLPDYATLNEAANQWRLLTGR